jgi:acyl carrier protein
LHTGDEGFVEARSVIGAAWAVVLGHEPTHGTEDFFELGGKSLSAMQISARLTRDFGAQVPVRWIFEFPVLNDLARHIATTLA